MTKSKPSPPLERGKVYCLESFQSLLKQWLGDEVRRHTQQQLQQRSNRRVQPSRTAKGGINVGDYVLLDDDIAQAQEKSETTDNILKLHESIIKKVDEHKAKLSESYQPPMGVRHVCTLAGLHWDCIHRDSCAHGVIESAMKVVPAKADNNLKWRLRDEFEQLIAQDKDGVQSEEPGALKKSATLRKRVKSRIAQLQTETALRCDAPMLPTPSLGAWPDKELPREDLEAQTVECLGLKFAVDVCRGSGQCRILML